MSDQTPENPVPPSAPQATPPAYPAAPPYGQPAGAYPPPAAPAYGAPAGYTPYPAAPKTNTLAIVSLISSLAGVVIVAYIGQIVGIITGHMALHQIKERGENGRGLALAGVIVGYVSLALYIVLGIVFIVIFVAIVQNGSYYDYDYSS
ncbi:MAG: DUF4190 domain-containing protein [Microbacterium sp.]|uniref:DUF4190 domain-containing protein n=1 Tax=Microbacterium sp. TaxID=51671 RepID=UPI0026262733|nr:DUF4190 domain-containing protein [Microbacterium sp.]MCX6502401.1 DUF4190 domain-containing protein [Microbacterium sp.]